MIDRDSGGGIPRQSDDLVNVYLISILSNTLRAGSSNTISSTFSGRLDFSTIRLSVELECQPGFIGEDCRPDPNTIVGPPTESVVPVETTSQHPSPTPTMADPSPTMTSQYPTATINRPTTTAIYTTTAEVTAETTSKVPVLVTGDQNTGGTPSEADITTSSGRSDGSNAAFISGVAVGGAIVFALTLVFTSICLCFLIFSKIHKKITIPTADNVVHGLHGKWFDHRGLVQGMKMLVVFPVTDEKRSNEENVVYDYISSADANDILHGMVVHELKGNPT